MTEWFSKEIKNHNARRASFNELTEKTFGFNFVDWYEAGHWGDLYVPHALLEDDKVISNVSVNWMRFHIQKEGDEVCSERDDKILKTYLQLGTVMTDPEYRGAGRNREIMERILTEYGNKVDGIYLFGNDDVLGYYPKFGFRPVKEYEYYMKFQESGEALSGIKGDSLQSNAYQSLPVDMSRQQEQKKVYDFIEHLEENNCNDAMYMYENLNLYQFWLAAGLGEHVYYLPEAECYVIAEREEETLRVHQVFGSTPVEWRRLAGAFGPGVKELVLGFTPIHREGLQIREHKEEDCTLFVLGEDLLSMEKEQKMFPIMSHA